MHLRIYINYSRNRRLVRIEETLRLSSRLISVPLPESGKNSLSQRSRQWGIKNPFCILISLHKVESIVYELIIKGTC